MTPEEIQAIMPEGYGGDFEMTCMQNYENEVTYKGVFNMTRKEVAGLSKLEINSVYQGDCLELMKNIADGSVDMILADLP